MNELTYSKGDLISKKWKLIKLIGEGGNSFVWKACNINNKNELIALKIISKNKDGNINFNRIKNEISTQKELTKKGARIIPLLDSNFSEKLFSKEDPIWIAMPLAKVSTEKLHKASVEEILVAIKDIGEALIDCTSKKIGFLHRDIKPRNLFFYNNQWCLGDLGLVTFKGKKVQTKKGDRIGSQNFIAQEVLKDISTASEKSEVYALAKSMYCLLSGNNFPIAGPHIIDDKHTTIRDYIEYDKSSFVDNLLSRATLNDPSCRISLTEFIEELKCILIKNTFSNQISGENISSLLKDIQIKTMTDKMIEDKFNNNDVYIREIIKNIHLKLEKHLQSIGIVDKSMFLVLDDYVLINYFISKNIPEINRNKNLCYDVFIRIKGGGNQEKGYKFMIIGIGIILLDDEQIRVVSSVLFEIYNKDIIEVKNSYVDVGLRTAKEKTVIDFFIGQIKKDLPEYTKVFSDWI